MNRDDFITVWAERVKKDTSWRKEHTAFINAQIRQANAFYARLLRIKGEEEFRKVTGASKTCTEHFKQHNKL